jgi:FKBP-type peptidyl-prolyl cis-trans isomerase
MPSLTDPSWQPSGNQGLRLWDVAIGTGATFNNVPGDPPSNTSDNARVFYTGWLASNGVEFDSNRTSTTPANFDADNLIVGFAQALEGMRVGGIRRVDIPPELGYGAAGSPPRIPPNARLVFEIKLVGIGPA